VMVGWTDEGSPVTTGLPCADEFVSRLNNDVGMVGPNDHPVNEEFGGLAEQINAGLIASDDGTVFRRRNGVWACVCPPDTILTIADAALICGCERSTLSTYIARGLPRGNRFPQPDMTTGHSGDKAMRLWWPITILRWIARRPGRGYRSDWSLDILT
jgi:hypothetical protein